MRTVGLGAIFARKTAGWFSILVASFLLIGCPSNGGGMLGRGDIGSPCEAGDCKEGLTCLSGVPGGYCTLECEDATCPEGTFCASMSGVDLCLYECESHDDCREEYGCGGGVCRPACESRADCFGVESCQDGVCVADGIGAPCGHPTDCHDGLVCRQSLPGGYCTMCCEEDSCPSGTTCATWGGASYCFDDCTDDDDCRSGYVCNAGVCNLPCSDDAECAGGQVCVGDRCEGSGVGEECSTGADCEDGLSCFRGVSQGYCSVRCGGSGSCPVGSVCGSMMGEEWCLAACRSDLDCGDGLRCIDGGCTVPCVTDDDCIDGFCDVASGRCRGGDIEYLDFGDMTPGQTFEFEVDAGVHSISVLVHGHPSVTYYTGSIINPNGRNIVGTHWFGPPLRIYPSQETFTAQIPNSDSPELEIVPGTWRVRLDAYGSAAPARVKVLLRRPADGQDRDGGLALEVFIAPGGLGSGVTAANADSSSHVQGIFSRFQHYFTQIAGLSIDSISFNDLPSSYSSVTSETAYKQMFQTYSKDDVLNLFFIRSFSLGGESGVAGVAGGIPGPPRLGGTINSGVLIEDMGHWRYVGDGISHEAGHFMGLFHITESDGQTHDLISDTPRCPDLNNCPDGWRNLMFPALTGQMDRITPGQALVVRAFGGVD